MFFEELVEKYEETEKSLNFCCYTIELAIQKYLREKDSKFDFVNKWYVDKDTGTIVVYYVDIMGADRSCMIAGTSEILL